jgi:hypothetical protein
MILDRRTLLAAASGFTICWPAAFAETAPPVLETYERETGGRIGLYAENLATGAKLSWRADERFIMCSTFKASLAACVLARVDHGEDQLEQMIAYGPGDLLPYAPVAKHHHADRHGRKPAPFHPRRGAVTALAGTPHRLDVGLQNRSEPAARRASDRLEDWRQDRQQRQGRLR